MSSRRPPSVQSPCISVCELDTQSGFCKGCWRTRTEIATWAKLPDADKRVLIETLHTRRNAITGGRKRRVTRRASRKS